MFSLFCKKPEKVSYSQCGEDLIINFALQLLHVEKPHYLDIGAYDPVKLSNTFFFYEKGSRGVCVEPDPIQYKKIKTFRPQDICLNVGIGEKNVKSLDFYIMTTNTLSTFSKDAAVQMENATSQKIKNIIKIPVLTIDKVIKQYFPTPPDFVSIDVEGVDEIILKSIDYKIFRPKVFCIETITYTENKTEKKVESIINLMEKNNYFVYADTYINTIFVDKLAWKKR